MKQNVEKEQTKSNENPTAREDHRPTNETQRKSLLVRTALKAGLIWQCW